jgi:hypothetical protein
MDNMNVKINDIPVPIYGTASALHYEEVYWYG